MPPTTTSGSRDREPMIVTGAGSTQEATEEKRRWGLTALLLILAAGAVAARRLGTAEGAGRVTMINGGRRPPVIQRTD